MLDSEIFRELDIRGIVGKNIFSKVAYQIGQIFGRYFTNLGYGIQHASKNYDMIAIGHDSRISSPKLYEEFICGFMQQTYYVEVITLGLATSPLVYYSIHDLEVIAGVMVTASHNPPDHNGFKFYIPSDDNFSIAHLYRCGQEMYKEKEFLSNPKTSTNEGILYEFSNRAFNYELNDASPDLEVLSYQHSLENDSSYEYIRNHSKFQSENYKEFLKDREYIIDPYNKENYKAISEDYSENISDTEDFIQTSLDHYFLMSYYAKILESVYDTFLMSKEGCLADYGWDCGNSSMGRIQYYFQDYSRVRYKDNLLYNPPSTLLGSRNLNPSLEEDLVYITNLVRKNKLKAGFAFDMDGDRLGVVDEKGRVMSMEEIGILLVKYITIRVPYITNPVIICDVKMSDVFLQTIEELGLQYILSPSGHSKIRKNIQKHKAIFGIENSGHIYFNDLYYGYDDAFYVAIRIVEIVEYYINRYPKTIRKKNPELGIRGQIGLSHVMEYAQIPKIFSCEIRQNLDHLSFSNLSNEDNHLRVGNRVINKILKYHEDMRIEYDNMDGVRVSRPKEGVWYLFRVSNTENVIVICYGGNDKKLINKAKECVIHILFACDLEEFVNVAFECYKSQDNFDENSNNPNNYENEHSSEIVLL